MECSARVTALSVAWFVFLGGHAVAAEMLHFNEAAFRAAQRSGAPILVETYSAGCPICWVQEGTIRELVRKPEYNGLRVFVIDADNRKDAMRIVGAQTRSTLVVYKEGQEVARAVGTTRPDEIAALIAKAY